MSDRELPEVTSLSASSVFKFPRHVVLEELGTKGPNNNSHPKGRCLSSLKIGNTLGRGTITLTFQQYERKKKNN
jgi:hypothetical protein